MLAQQPKSQFSNKHAQKNINMIKRKTFDCKCVSDHTNNISG